MSPRSAARTASSSMSMPRPGARRAAGCGRRSGTSTSGSRRMRRSGESRPGQVDDVLLGVEVGHRQVELEAGRQRDRSEGAVGGELDVVCLGRRRDAEHLGDAARVRPGRVARSRCRPRTPAGTRCARTGARRSRSGMLVDATNASQQALVLRTDRLLEERRQGVCAPRRPAGGRAAATPARAGRCRSRRPDRRRPAAPRGRPRNAPIWAGVSRNATGPAMDALTRVYPRSADEHPRPVGTAGVPRVTPGVRVHPHPIAAGSAEEHVDGLPEPVTPQVPERLVEARDGRGQHRAAPVEAAPRHPIPERASRAAGRRRGGSRSARGRSR